MSTEFFIDYKMAAFTIEIEQDKIHKYRLRDETTN